MLAKARRAQQTGDFRPMACLRLLYKVYAYMIPGLIEDTLESQQPEEQCGFRQGRRLEENVLAANVVIDKARNADVLLWLVSLDLSKAFDRVHWPALWGALRQQGVSPHHVWALQCIYQGQLGQVVGTSSCSKLFDVSSGVRQGCVLSPRLFTAVLEHAMRRWRLRVEHLGFDLMDGGNNLLELRLADDILVFAGSELLAWMPLDTLAMELSDVGLVLNSDKTVALTNQAQPPATTTTPNGICINVVPRDAAHKWIGCFLSFSSESHHAADVNHHIQTATKAFYANRAILCMQNTSVKLRLRYFHATISQIACFGAGCRKVSRQATATLDIAWRKLVRQIVGPPQGIDWSQPWNQILHAWNARAMSFAAAAKIPSWGEECLRRFWDFAGWAARLPGHRWVKRLLAWQPAASGGRRGRPCDSWEEPLIRFCRYRGFPPWQTLALLEARWSSLRNEFVIFMS
jgi:hypothetical protein